MDFQTLDTLRKRQPSWRLLLADSAPLVASFLHSVFIAGNVRSIPQPELTAKLEDALFLLHECLGDDAFPWGPREYLDEWASDGKEWLHKDYPPGGDEKYNDASI